MTTADKINDQLDVALCQSVVKDSVIVWQGKEYAV